MISMVVKKSAIFFGSCAAQVFISICGHKTTNRGTCAVVKHDSKHQEAAMLEYRETRQQHSAIKSPLCALI
jgi:uncharacterized Zn finger protein